MLFIRSDKPQGQNLDTTRLVGFGIMELQAIQLSLVHYLRLVVEEQLPLLVLMLKILVQPIQAIPEFIIIVLVVEHLQPMFAMGQAQR